LTGKRVYRTQEEEGDLGTAPLYGKKKWKLDFAKKVI